jgi:hypothetical protein
MNCLLRSGVLADPTVLDFASQIDEFLRLRIASHNYYSNAPNDCEQLIAVTWPALIKGASMHNLYAILKPYVKGLNIIIKARPCDTPEQVSDVNLLENLRFQLKTFLKHIPQELACDPNCCETIIPQLVLLESAIGMVGALNVRNEGPIDRTIANLTAILDRIERFIAFHELLRRTMAHFGKFIADWLRLSLSEYTNPHPHKT